MHVQRCVYGECVHDKSGECNQVYSVSVVQCSVDKCRQVDECRSVDKCRSVDECKMSRDEAD